MTRSIRHFRASFREGWKEIADKCKIMDFLNQREGKMIVSDFHAKLKQYDGSRFVESFENALSDLADQSYSYMLMPSPLGKAYQLLESNALDCLMKNNLPREDAIRIIAICIFWILHEQNAEV